MSVFRDVISVMSLLFIFAGSLFMFGYIFVKVLHVNEPVRYEKKTIIRKTTTKEEIEHLIELGPPLMENPHSVSPS